MMMRRKQSGQGFTLIELAIVVGIAGLLFAGLWRLMAGGSQQLTEQAAADQQRQLINAVKAFLASGGGAGSGQNWLNAFDGTLAVSETRDLPLPVPGGACAAAIARFCDFLPVGFTNATLNPFGQSYQIRVRRNDNAAAGTAPTAYEFMIVTNGGNAIPDTQGSRLSALIGADGGFVYTNDNPCSAAGAQTSFACGSFGSFVQDITTYGNANAAGSGFAAGGGRVASRSAIVSGVDTLEPWLARQVIPGDPALPAAGNNFNTMTTSLRMAGGGNNILVNGNNVEMAAGTVNMGGGTVNLSSAAGTINLDGGTVNMGGGSIQGNGQISISSIFTPLTVVSNGGLDAVSVSGNVRVSNGDIDADNRIFGREFIYKASDVRLKHDIVKIDDALDKVMEMRGVYFSWNKDNSKDVGVVAQEVEKVFPEAVHTSSDGTKGVDYAKLIGPVIEALRDLKQENDALHKELEDQKAELEKLKKRAERSAHQK